MWLQGEPPVAGGSYTCPGLRILSAAGSLTNPDSPAPPAQDMSRGWEVPVGDGTRETSVNIVGRCGLQTRRRTCLNPAPTRQGRDSLCSHCQRGLQLLLPGSPQSLGVIPSNPVRAASFLAPRP